MSAPCTTPAKVRLVGMILIVRKDTETLFIAHYSLVCRVLRLSVRLEYLVKAIHSCAVLH